MILPPPHPFEVLHLNSALTGGGTDDQCAKLAYGLRALGHQVSVAGPDGREFSRTIREMGVPFHSIAPDAILKPFKLGFILRAARLIRRERIEIVHAHHGRDYWPALLSARWSGRRPRVVLTRHLAKSPSSFFSRRLLLNQCDALIAVSNFVARVLREGVYEPDSPEPERRARPPLRGDYAKIHVLYGAIDSDRFRPVPAEDARVQALRRDWGLAAADYAFGVVGGYDLPRGKGQREFLEAAAQIQQKIPRARFLIIGRGNMAAELEADIERFGLTSKARLTPYCTDMPTAMNSLDCLVHPQVGTEAFGLVLLEAFACGKPVIASALDGIPEAFALGNVGQLVPAEDIGALAQAMADRALLPPLDALERGALHERVAKSCSVATAASNMTRIYCQLSRGDRPSSSSEFHA